VKGEEPSIFKHSEYVWPKAAQRLHKGINVNNFSADTTLSHNLQTRDGKPLPYKEPALYKMLLTNKKWCYPHYSGELTEITAAHLSGTSSILSWGAGRERHSPCFDFIWVTSSRILIHVFQVQNNLQEKNSVFLLTGGNNISRYSGWTHKLSLNKNVSYPKKKKRVL
jgi:hypothetical protein